MTTIAGSVPKPPPDALGRGIVWVDSRLAKVEDTFALIAALTIGFLMFLGTGQVILRKVFNAPIFGYIDIVEVSMGVFAFMAAAYCQRLGGHIRMDIIVTRLPSRPRWIFEGMGCLLGAAVIFVLAWYGWGHMMRAFLYGDSTIDINLPLWPSKILVPLAFTPLIVRLLLQTLAYLRLAINPDADPVGVPRALTIEEEAEREIREALGSVDTPKAS